MARLGDVCKLVSGNSLPDNIVSAKGELPYVKVAELNLSENIPNITTARNFVSIKDVDIKQIVPVGTVIFPKRGGAIGTNKKRLVSVPICMDLNLMGVIPSSDVLPEYLYYYFENVDMGSLSNGSSVPQINNSDIAPLDIWVPEKAVQREIYLQLDKICELLALRKQQLAKLDELVKARFIEMFGDPISNSMRWPYMPISDICKEILGGGTPSKSHPEYFTGHIPWVSPKDMKQAVISDSIDHITEEAISHSTTNLIPINSVLVVIRSGILKHTLPVAINSVPVTINQDMKAFIPGEAITTAFLMYYFKAIETDVLAGVRSVTADNIDFKAFVKRNAIIPPKHLQERFTTFVEQTDKSKLSLQQSIDQLETLKKSLMQKYFG